MKHSRERGTYIVEFAILLPIIIFLSLIAVEGANIFRVFQLTMNASREGARLAVMAQNAPGANGSNTPTTTCTITPTQSTSTNPICEGVADYIQTNNAIGTNALIQCPSLRIDLNQHTAIGPNFGSKITATCPYSLHYLPRLPFFTVAQTLNIKSTTTFRNFY